MMDNTMVVNCVVYQNGKKLRDITIEEISDVLEQEGTFVWVGLLEPDAAMMREIQKEFGLHDLAVEDAYAAHQRPKIEEYGDTLFVVVQTAQLDAAEVVFGETHIFLGPRFVVTVRHGASRSYAAVRKLCENVPERLAHGPSYVMYSIIDFVVDHYQPVMDDLEARFVKFETALFEQESEEGHLKDLYQLKRQLIKLRSGIAPVVEICSQLLRFHDGFIPKDSRVYYRDIQDHVVRLLDTGDRLREMIAAAMQVDLAQVTIRQNEVVKRLAGWGAILAIPTMVFSLYGMNFKFMPELEWHWAYPTVLVGIVVSCSWLFARLRRVGWL
ncbi:magnesium and cobalt transport protein CorA [Herbaspirillum sp. RTI4]|uniref:magnesium and cobalt transport protein CorA n=1 Tax=Herbaspirillum sp. RTI4 TaxID=3048640 RepID=UPI002AB37D0A|nr:magnesium and cobalt transport protein CorA [Herbaspirillum sp. RTI4]MDY7579817.1 magnesium and cobalt transport protein CorA [Herbaspirillum sp. RTI4]MEA9981904.1 magnesium and cobalt transport protein CorA [Herbaspirillum sp. RTI4]